MQPAIVPVRDLPSPQVSELGSAPPDSEDERAYYRLSRRVYGSWFASIYETITLPLRRIRHLVARLAGIAPGMQVIDVATGTGGQARAFGAAGAKVLGIDLSSRMLAIARRKTHRMDIQFLEADATAVPAEDATFDAACVSFALHEMPATVRERVVTEMVRVTRPGGKIIVVDYGLPRSRWWRAIVERFVRLYERDHYAEFVRSDVNELLGRAGVSVLKDQRAVLGAARILIGQRGR